MTFAPASPGPRSGTLSVTKANGTVHAESLTGFGKAGRLEVRPAAVVFNEQAVKVASPSQDVTLTNTGDAPLTIKKVTGTGDMGDFGMRSDCPWSQLSPARLSSPPALEVGKSCGITVWFSPTTAGRREAVLVITDEFGTRRTASGVARSVSCFSLVEA